MNKLHNTKKLNFFNLEKFLVTSNAWIFYDLGKYKLKITGFFNRVRHAAYFDVILIREILLNRSPRVAIAVLRILY